MAPEPESVPKVKSLGRASDTLYLLGFIAHGSEVQYFVWRKPVNERLFRLLFLKGSDRPLRSTLEPEGTSVLGEAC